MADIAFLLLIFFLVTTEIQQDQGLLVRLPVWQPEEQPIVNPPSNNVFTVLLNADDELLVEGDEGRIASLRAQTKEFVMNPARRKNLASAPTKAVVSLRNDRSSSYAAYLTVYNELKGAYRELWDEAALRSYDQASYDLLTPSEQLAVRQAIPMVISEAEPSDFAADLTR